MDIELLDYGLPPELVAQTPLEPRDGSRLLVYRRASGAIEHRTVAELPVLSGELVVVERHAHRPHASTSAGMGGAVEVLLVEQLDGGSTWEALVRPSRRLRGRGVGVVSVRHSATGGGSSRFAGGHPVRCRCRRTSTSRLPIPERYQTVYGAVEGSAAAPTAGLHLTRALHRRVRSGPRDLHVGLDTFRPVVESSLEEHALHGERYTMESRRVEEDHGGRTRSGCRHHDD